MILTCNRCFDLRVSNVSIFKKQLPEGGYISIFSKKKKKLLLRLLLNT